MHLAYSLSKPLDFELSDEVQLTLAASVVVKVLHDASGMLNSSLALEAGSTFVGRSWTAVALPEVVQDISFAILDSPVSPRTCRQGVIFLRNACPEK